MTPGICKYPCHERYYSSWYSEYVYEGIVFSCLSYMIVTNSPAQQIDTIAWQYIAGADPGFFLGGGGGCTRLLLYFNTNKSHSF